MVGVGVGVGSGAAVGVGVGVEVAVGVAVAERVGAGELAVGLGEAAPPMQPAVDRAAAATMRVLTDARRRVERAMTPILGTAFPDAR
ncbi:hypothetical protein GCM10017602_21600 [Herbiconiux flava]|nr:hypothetical protein GCM10017602_21600 [Herbiconiux flava]